VGAGRRAKRAKRLHRFFRSLLALCALPTTTSVRIANPSATVRGFVGIDSG